jgi:hypothetical protein
MLQIISASKNSSFNLRSVLEKEKLNGTNFIDWYHNLRIVLRQEKRSMFSSSHTLMISVMVQMLQPGELMKSIVMTHLMSIVSCLPPCPLIYGSSMSMLMLTPRLRGYMECLRTKLGLRGTTSQSPYCMQAGRG